MLTLVLSPLNVAGAGPSRGNVIKNPRMCGKKSLGANFKLNNQNKVCV